MRQDHQITTRVRSLLRSTCGSLGLSSTPDNLPLSGDHMADDLLRRVRRLRPRQLFEARRRFGVLSHLQESNLVLQSETLNLKDQLAPCIASAARLDQFSHDLSQRLSDGSAEVEADQLQHYQGFYGEDRL
jgi:hypothetical protein